MHSILLTSTGLSSSAVYSCFEDIVKSNNYHSAVIITTASEEKEFNKYAQIAREQLASLGLSTAFVDIETVPNFDFSLFDIIYVMGGNTFRLLKYAKQANFAAILEVLFNRGGTYVGVSAGTHILSPSINVANEISTDTNDVGLSNFSSFSFVPFYVSVHYDKSKESKIIAFETKYQTKVERLSDTQALLIQGNEKKLIGE